jgi:hypothetical protein
VFGRRKSQALTLLSEPQRGLARIIAKGCWRYRRQLVPFAVSWLVLGAGIAALILRSTAGTGWLIATYAVGCLCAAAWLTRLNGYDRGLAAVILTAAGIWTVLVAYQPAALTLYGVWFLATPVLGLGWWLSGTLRAQLRADKVQAKWAKVAQLAGIAGAHLLSSKKTPAGEVLSVKLDAGQTAEDISRKKLESAYELRPGAVKVEPDKTNARRVTIHMTETDPWTAELSHPALAVLHTNN